MNLKINSKLSTKLISSLVLIPFLYLNSCSNVVNPLNTQESLEDGYVQTLNLDNALILKFKDKISQAKIQELKNKFKFNSFDIISNDLNMIRVQFNNSNGIDNLKNDLSQNNLIEYAIKDQKLGLLPFNSYPVNSQTNSFSSKSATPAVPNDTFYGLQWNISNIEADKAWTITTGSSNVVVAVIDSGVDPDHPDLKDNLLPLIDVWNESEGSDIYIGGGRTVNFGGRDGNGHGTHVTGILAASINNAKGIAGVAGNVKILPIKAANNEGNTSASIITRSIMKAIENEARVINLSIGEPKSEGTKALKDAVDLAIQKGIVFISASGNESNRSTNFVEEVTVPAAYEGVISVAATTKFDKVANYSNGGPEVEIAAPGGGGRTGEGEKIYSTWPTYKTREGYRSNITGPYALLSGTSMSCPHVSATAALLLSREPNLTGQQVRVRILSTVQDVETKGFDTSTGYGKLNVYNALIMNTHDKK